MLRSRLARPIRTKALSIFAICLLSWPGSCPVLRAQSPEEGQISALRSRWIQTLKAKQLDDAMALYDANAVFYSPGEPPTAGLPAIRALFKTVMASYDSDINMQNTRIAISGELAYDSGEYQEVLTNRQTNAKLSIKGNYLAVLHRTAAGQWQIVQHMWTMRPAS